MTTITFNEPGSEGYLHVRKDGRSIARVTPASFYALSPDIDLHETAAKAIAQQGEPVAVPNTTKARGMRPKNSQRHGVIL